MSRLPVHRMFSGGSRQRSRAAAYGAIRKIALAVAVLALAAGQLSATAVAASAPGAAAEFTTRQGAAEMTSSVDRTAAQIAEPVRLTVSVRVPEGVTVSFPASPDALGAFDVTDVTDKADIPEGDHRRWTRIYELESLMSGEQQIPEIAVAFTDRRDGMARQDVITSKPISISIASVLEGQADPTQFRDIKGVVDVPIIAAPSYTGWWIAGGVGAVLAALALIAVARKRRPLNAEQWALAEIDRLVEARHVEQGHVGVFYSRLTDIVRAYIERRFEIAAPRLTTDEFLAQIQEDETFDREHGELLRAFLTQADIVKFASYQPATSDGNEAVETARRFVRETAPTNKQPQPQAAGQEA